MKLALVLSILLLIGCATAHTSRDPLSFDDRPIAKACLTDPPPTTDIFWTNFCEDLLGIDERERAHQRAWAKHETPGCDAVCRYHIERDIKRERTMTPAPARHAPPPCDADCQVRQAARRQAWRDVQMDDASFEAELRNANRNPFLGEAPSAQREPISCASSRIGSSTYTDCY